MAFSLFACKPGKKAADKDRNKYSVTTARFIRLIKTGVSYPFPVLSYWKVYNQLGMDRIGSSVPWYSFYPEQNIA